MKRTELKRKTALRAKAPIQRTGTLRTASFDSGKPETKRKGLRGRGPKMSPIRKSARGEDCLIQLPGTSFHDPATTVLCHSNQLADGKGMGLKAPDTRAAYGCHYCHDVVDGRRPLPPGLTQEAMLAKFDKGVALTHEKLKQKGLM
jgi:hypothetical protein